MDNCTVANQTPEEIAQKISPIATALQDISEQSAETPLVKEAARTLREFSIRRDVQRSDWDAAAKAFLDINIFQIFSNFIKIKNQWSKEKDPASNGYASLLNISGTVLMLTDASPLACQEALKRDTIKIVIDDINGVLSSLPLISTFLLIEIGILNNLSLHKESIEKFREVNAVELLLKIYQKQEMYAYHIF